MISLASLSVRKKMGLLENSPYQHSSQCHPALATKSIKKRLQPVEVAAVL